MLIYKCIIPINPKTKKNSMQVITKPKPRLMQSKAYRDYEKDCLKLIKRINDPINEPIIIKATYYRETRHRCDITNLNAALHDILVKAKIIADDNYKIVIGTDGSRVYTDKENPRTEISIYKVENNEIN